MDYFTAQMSTFTPIMNILIISRVLNAGLLRLMQYFHHFNLWQKISQGGEVVLLYALWAATVRLLQFSLIRGYSAVQ